MTTASDNAYPNQELQRLIQQQREDTSRWQDGENHSPNPNVDPSELKADSTTPDVERNSETTVESGPPVLTRVATENVESLEGSQVVLQDGEFSVVGNVVLDAEDGFVVNWATGRQSIEKKANYELVINKVGKIYTTIEEIKEDNSKAGFKFFDPTITTYFKAPQPLDKVFPCGVFITKDVLPSSNTTGFTIRKIKDDGKIESVTELGSFAKEDDAIAEAQDTCDWYCSQGHRQSSVFLSSEDSFVPPSSVASNAKRGLELRRKHNRGGTEVGVARARDLSNRKGLSYNTVKRMKAYFDRHEVDKKGEGWGKDSAGYIAWLLWGGDAGRSWANKIVKQHDKKNKSE